MKKYLTFLALLTLWVSPARAQFTVNLEAGELTGPSGTNTMMVDTSNPSNGTGSLLLLVDLGSSHTIDTALLTGHYVAGTNTILGSADFNNNGGFGGSTESDNAIITTSAGTPGDDIALFWFPQLTYNQFKSGALPVGGDYFGAYTPEPLGSAPDGGQAWTVPSSGTLSLNFYTVSDQGGSQPDSAGYANYQVESVPEPSTIALFGLGALLPFWLARRRKAV